MYFNKQIIGSVIAIGWVINYLPKYKYFERNQIKKY
jgi:hypothetical protein